MNTTMTKKLIIEFNVDENISMVELCRIAHDAMRTARLEVDTKLNRIGNDRGAALYRTVIRFQDFGDTNYTTIDGIFQPTRRHKKG